MKAKLISSLFILILIFGWQNSDAQKRKLPANMQYSFACITENTRSGQITDILNQADDYLTGTITSSIEVTDKEQNEFGDQFLTSAREDRSFVIDNRSPLNAKLQTVLSNLLRVRGNDASGLKYSIYLLDDDKTINAYTVGGKIFVTTAIIKKCTSDDQLYAIIGHEIGHNEKGHIRTTIKELKASQQYLGDYANSFFNMRKKFTGAFNQKKELEADYYGLDLVWKLGYDPCAIKAFWDDMASDESHSLYQDFFRTHPYSDVRSNCLSNHIKTNFKQNCN
jgi:predicted Zn-dependent protease